MSFMIIRGSLRPNSRSATMARVAREFLQAQGHEPDWLDLTEWELPICDGADSYNHPSVKALTPRIAAADGILISVPIYNYGINAAVKNLSELTGEAWEDKVVGFLCAAGGQSSYMSVMGFANGLMLDFRCFILPRFVYATGAAFDSARNLTDPEIRRRIEKLAAVLVTVSTALRTARTAELDPA